MSTHDHLPTHHQSHAIAGTFALPPKGIVLHSSRSGRTLTPDGKPWTVMREFQSTIDWAANPTNQWGWNLTIGPNVWATHMRADQYGINAGTKASSEYLAVEFSQARLGDPIVQEQVAAFVAAWHAYVVPAWPHLVAAEAVGRLLLPAHSEMPQGVSDGKTDPWPRNTPELEAFRRRLYAALRGTPMNPYWDQIGDGRGDEPLGPERFVHDPDRTNPDGTPQNITSHVDGRQRAYTYHHDSQRITVRSYEPLTPPG